MPLPCASPCRAPTAGSRRWSASGRRASRTPTATTGASRLERISAARADTAWSQPGTLPGEPESPDEAAGSFIAITSYCFLLW